MILSRYKIYAASFIYEAKKSSPVVLLLTVGLAAVLIFYNVQPGAAAD